MRPIFALLFLVFHLVPRYAFKPSLSLITAVYDQLLSGAASPFGHNRNSVRVRSIRKSKSVTVSLFVSFPLFRDSLCVPRMIRQGRGGRRICRSTKVSSVSIDEEKEGRRVAALERRVFWRALR
jgi:hypothetical protein